MNCAYVAEHHMADRYVMDQLTADEAQRFEDHYMSCDACLDEIDRAEVIARGFKRVGAEEMAKTAVVAAVRATWWQRHRAWLPLAATVLVTVSMLAFLLPRNPPGSQAPGRINTPVVYLQPERSSEEPPSRQLQLPDDGGTVVLVLELDPPFYPTYIAKVERKGGEVWVAENLQLGERDTVTLSLSAGILATGSHQLSLEAITSEGRQVSVGNFGFRVLE